MVSILKSKKIYAFMLCIIMCLVSFSDYFSMTARAGLLEDYAPVFNPAYYASRYKDVSDVYGNDANALLDHFITYGMDEGRQGCAEFSVMAYMDRYPDLRLQFGDNLKKYYMHYIEHGKAEGRNGREEILGVATSFNKNDRNATKPGQTPASKPAPTDVTKIYDIDDPNFNAFLADYYNDSVFIGDSIMVGFRNYAARATGSYLANVKFLAAGSYSLANALRPVTEDSLHPTFQGQKRQIWDSISLMGVKHVFIMFGTNDIGAYGVQRSLENCVTVVNNIKQLSPDVEIHMISMTYTLAGAGKGGLNNTNVDLFNAGVYGLCMANGWYYHDLCSAMSDGNGNMNGAYCSDGFVHVNNSGYSQCWEPFFASYAYSIYR